MTINDHIEVAWEKWEKEYHLSNDWRHPERKDCFHAGIAIGKDLALRELFVEVKPEDLKPDIPYLFVVNGEWRQRQVSIVELLRFLADEAEQVYMLNIPSPSDLFTEGRA